MHPNEDVIEQTLATRIESLDRKSEHAETMSVNYFNALRKLAGFEGPITQAELNYLDSSPVIYTYYAPGPERMLICIALSTFRQYQLMGGDVGSDQIHAMVPLVSRDVPDGIPVHTMDGTVTITDIATYDEVANPFLGTLE